MNITRRGFLQGAIGLAGAGMTTALAVPALKTLLPPPVLGGIPTGGGICGLLELLIEVEIIRIRGIVMNGSQGGKGDLRLPFLFLEKAVFSLLSVFSIKLFSSLNSKSLL